MRVAYQAGVLLALEEEGLTFFHGDGTSGGTMNLAMLLSGLSPAEMCERWRTLNVRDFVSFLRIKRYLRSLNWPAFGGADSLVQKVYPHLGIDAAHIRAAEGIEGTFNVCDFGEKTNWAVPHREVDEDLLRRPSRLVVGWSALQKLGASAAMSLAVALSVFSYYGIILAGFDFCSALLAIAYWLRVAR